MSADVQGLPQYQHLMVERWGPALLITLNRPSKLNAVDATMHTELLSAFRYAQDDLESRLAIITGAGRGFCSGGDVAGVTGTTGIAARPENDVQDPARHFVDALLSIEKPVIAMVNGPASGVGATIALMCDIIISAEDATFSDRHVNVGLVAGDGGSVIWPLLVGIARAKEMLMTGRLIDGREAERIGLINHAVPGSELRAYTMSLAEELASLPPFAVRATKAAVNRQLRRAVELDLDTALAWERLSMLRDDHREAVRKFQSRKKDRS